ncbi:hypothetical protein SELMODRAFT_430452 [Selaginella moellendorffii]|uniref:Uncharacterized protein n=1 Tax=Selaginella moellendorffii TaxID=88036 RepID=D8T9G7_SELML|nr:hypothetical protein SELMODRAFT_430452 [Selaginella moellendorffii]
MATWNFPAPIHKTVLSRVTQDRKDSMVNVPRSLGRALNGDLATYRRINETHRKVNYRTSNTANERRKPEETQLFYKRLIPWQVRRTSTNEKDGIQQERALKQYLLEDVLKDIARVFLYVGC